jgi:hypothetical protein
MCGELRLHTQQTPNHVIHAVLTFFTGGLWAIPWMVLAMNAKPAICSRCGSARQVHQQFLLGTGGPPPQTTQELENAVDEALRKVKGPLRTSRVKHGLLGDVTFRLRYDPTGTITGVTIDNGPPNITPGFIQDSTTIIKGMLVLPPSMNGGVMLFTDLDAEKNEPYR